MAIIYLILNSSEKHFVIAWSSFGEQGLTIVELIKVCISIMYFNDKLLFLNTTNRESNIIYLDL